MGNQKQKILIIEDSPMFSDLLIQALNAYDCILAASGEDAIDMIISETKPPAMVICDFYLPGLDGVETMKQIKEIHPTIKWFLVSGAMKPDELAEVAFKNRADAYLAKPMKMEDLLKQVNDLLEA